MDPISERAGAKKVRRRDHFLWRRFREEMGGREDEGDEMEFEHTGMRLYAADLVQIPKGPVVFVFETDTATIVWYSKSDLVLVNGILYFIYFDYNNLFASNAWLACGYSCSFTEIAVIKNSGMEYELNSGGNILSVSGMRIHRCTGEVLPRKAIAQGMRMRPSVPWHSRGFFHDVKAFYSQQGDLFYGHIINLQRWSRSTRFQREQMVKGCRSYGWFKLLSDDLFQLILERVFVPLNRMVEFQPARVA